MHLHLEIYFQLIFILLFKLHGMENLFQRVELPAFHAYGHRAKCQVMSQFHMHTMHNFFLQMLFSPLRTQGVGPSDREVIERLWSFL